MKNRALFIRCCAIHRRSSSYSVERGDEPCGSAQSTRHGSPQDRELKAGQLIARHTVRRNPRQNCCTSCRINHRLWPNSSYSIVLPPTINALQVQQRQLTRPLVGVQSHTNAIFLPPPDSPGSEQCHHVRVDGSLIWPRYVLLHACSGSCRFKLKEMLPLYLFNYDCERFGIVRH